MRKFCDGSVVMTVQRRRMHRFDGRGNGRGEGMEHVWGSWSV